ncbi:helix-turn-helix transcriptional regulator [Lysinibacillus sp. NPDC047702]|uniref:helix-turn-helix transcriptional regulator n=1 Tax=unclassified Lysinibacillus TaxID=2636778 RepID=UPI003D07E342
MQKTRNWLKQLRVSKGYTQEQVAESTKMSRSLYGHIESGTRGATVKNAKKIAELLEFDWTLFFVNDSYEMKLKNKVS